MFSTNARFKTPSPHIEKRIDALLATLSLEEKIDLLGGHPHQGSTRGNPRAAIPELKMADGPVGVHWFCKTSTAYPASIGNAAAWDPDLAYQLGRALGRDARARGVHILLAPGVNIYRSPLCGRNFEYLGEDPCLAARIVTAYIEGVQAEGVSATVKHYAANYQEFDRHGVSSDLDERTLHEVYLPAFKAAVVDAGVGCVMTAYNLVNGIHCSEHGYLINTVLKASWGFEGLVMSDWVSTYSAAGAANGGLDLEMPTAQWMNREKLLPEVRAGRVSEALIDDKVRRLLRLAICFGWMEHPQEDSSIPMDDRETADVALEVARCSMVLLKNQDSILPLDRSKLRRIAVVGPNADPAVIGGGGSAYTEPTHAVSVLEGVRAIVRERVEVVYASGPAPAREFRAFKTCELRTERGEPGLAAWYYNNPRLEGEAALTRTDEHVDFWFGSRPPAEQLSEQHFSVRWSGYITPPREGSYLLYANAGDGGYRVWLDGHLVFDTWENEQSGTQRVELHLPGGTPLALRIEYRKTRHWAQMHFGWESKDGIQREIDEALAAVEGADAVIVCVGFNKSTEGEGWDRSFALEESMERMLVQVSGRNPNTVVVLNGGGNVDMSGWIDAVKGLLHAWYPGQEGGTAVAEILFGAVNPSGKLPATFEARLQDRSSHECYHDDDGDKHVRLSDGIFTGYRHHDLTGVAPRFPFGFGLSYTTFEYRNLSLSASRVGPDDSLMARFEVRNTGPRAGAEVAQLYICDKQCRLPRPVKELKSFAKVLLEPGESAQISMDISRADLSFYDPAVHDWVCEAGEFTVLIGASSADIRLQDSFVLLGKAPAAVRPKRAKSAKSVKPAKGTKRPKSAKSAKSTKRSVKPRAAKKTKGKATVTAKRGAVTKPKVKARAAAKPRRSRKK